MSDIIVLNPCEFYKRKDPTFDHAFVDKYRELFNKYNCFSDNAVVIIQSAINTKQPKRHPNVIRREQKTLKRTLLGILNVMNDDNYKKMLIKTKMLITSENLKEVFTEILEKCVYQVFYLCIYSAFIKDLLASLPDVERQTAIQLINDFVEEFVNGGYVINVPKTDDSYHDFCALQKSKMRILAKHQIILEFLKTDIISVTDMTRYSDIIYKAFNDNINTNIEQADVLLQMMMANSKQGASFDKEVLSKIKTVNKLQFMIDNILKISV